MRPAATLEANLRDNAASPEELNLACTLVDSVQVVRLEPERYCPVRSLGWTRHGRLRGASFAGLIER